MSTATLFSQNERAKWFWGEKFGMDCMTSPPVMLAGSMMSTWTSASSMCDASGNLLFYTDGMTVYNKLHQVMANGSGLPGYGIQDQGSVIVKQPGNTNIYYVFVLHGSFSNQYNSGLYYSIVDMNLAGGTGSVTVKNVLLYYSLNLPHKMAAVERCGGDTWIMIHEPHNNTFRAYLLSNFGIANTITTSIGTPHNASTNDYHGEIRFSPGGNKLAAAYWYEKKVDLYDFDVNTGALSNSIVLVSGFPDASGLGGVEFSADGSKLYATASVGKIHQWDLCAGSPSAIVASLTSLTPTCPVGITNLLRAPTGKIYICKSTCTQYFLGVINDPNNAGTACNYQESGPQLNYTLTQGNTYMLPNFVERYVPPAFTSSVISCSERGFLSPFSASTLCIQPREPIAGVSWDFGDPSSGQANVSSLTAPTHSYSAPGTYTVKHVLHYSFCADTIKQTVTIGLPPTLTITPNLQICSGDPALIAVSGAGTYSWSHSSADSVLTVTPANTTTYSVIGVLLGCQSGASVVVNVVPMPTLSINGPTMVCLGNSVTLNASGAVTYSWSNGQNGPVALVSPTALTTYWVAGSSAIQSCSDTLATQVSVSACNAIGDLSEDPGVGIYPNPFSDHLSIQSDSHGHLVIYSCMGIPLLESEIRAGHSVIETASLPNGIYLASVICNGRISGFRVVRISE
jgi:hypothetical protein